MSDNDDLPIGRRLSRREAVELFGAGAVSLFFARVLEAMPSRADELLPSSARAGFTDRRTLACIERPEMTEGPYFVDKQLERADIRVEPSTGVPSAGVPLTIAFSVASVASVASNACEPLPDAVVDIWQCDADGVYSGVNDAMSGNNTAGKKFLRGFLKTNRNGQATFTTVYPGWYPGRAVHIHFKIRTIGADAKAYEFTSQLFFDDSLSDQVFTSAPYKRDRVRDTRNANDGIYQSGGKELTLALTKSASGYTGAISVGLDLTDSKVGRSDGMGSGRGGPPGRGRGGPPGGAPGGPPGRGGRPPSV